MWRRIPDYNYEVSSRGLMRHSVTKRLCNFQTQPRGYKYVVCYSFADKKNHTLSLHRMVALAFIPNPSSKPDVNHKDGNKNNNRSNNLEWVTAKENVRHARDVLGVDYRFISGRAKLNLVQAQEIRDKYKPRVYTLPQLAKEYAVSQPTICRIIYGESY